MAIVKTGDLHVYGMISFIFLFIAVTTVSFTPLISLSMDRNIPLEFSLPSSLVYLFESFMNEYRVIHTAWPVPLFCLPVVLKWYPICHVAHTISKRCTMISIFSLFFSLMYSRRPCERHLVAVRRCSVDCYERAGNVALSRLHPVFFGRRLFPHLLCYFMLKAWGSIFLRFALILWSKDAPSSDFAATLSCRRMLTNDRTPALISR